MTDHPAKPAGYKPFRDPAQIEADARADERDNCVEAIRFEISARRLVATDPDPFEHDFILGLTAAANIARGDA